MFRTDREEWCRRNTAHFAIGENLIGESTESAPIISPL